ncbi:MAG: glycosyltransferase [Pseudomonadota bacterium]
MANNGKSRDQVSVILPVRNCEDRIAELIERVLDQGSAVREVIVADQNSTDETVSVALSVGDPRVRIVCLARCGVEEATRVAAREAKEDWVLVCEAAKLAGEAPLTTPLENARLLPRKRLSMQQDSSNPA